MEGLIDEKDVICDIEGVPGGPKKRIKSQPTETVFFLDFISAKHADIDQR